MNIPEFFGITIIPHVANVASPTLNINSLGAIALEDQKGATYAAGKLLAGKPYMFRKVGSDFLADSGSGGGRNLQPNQALSGFTFTKDSGEQVGLGDADLIPANILKAVNIFGVIGTLESQNYARPIQRIVATSRSSLIHMRTIMCTSLTQLTWQSS